MSWNAPELSHLLDQRLQVARLELMEDSRIALSRQTQNQESTDFLRHLIDEKLASATRSGLGAIEASLRTDASLYLSGAGCDAGTIRKVLDESGADLTDIDGVTLPSVGAEPPKPAILALAFLVSWVVIVAVGWVLKGSPFSSVAYLLLAGIPVAGIIYGIARAAALQRRTFLVRHYPTRLCSTYFNFLGRQVDSYESAVNGLETRTGQLPSNL